MRLFSKQIGMGSCVYKGECQDSLVLSVAQEPIGTDVKFSCSCENAREFVVVKFLVKNLISSEHLNNGFEFF